MPRLRFSRNARADLQEIARFIARDKPGAARKWIKTVKTKCRLVADHPKLGESREDLGPGVRTTLVGSYVIFYRILGDNLEVSRIVRGDRDVDSLWIPLNSDPA
jgi:toxin ParE1/3/4